MHELPVTQNILEIALRHAGISNAKRIISLNITIGQLASVIDDSIQFYWDLIAKDTLAEGATLNFHRLPLEILCLECNFAYKPEVSELACPLCKGTRVKIISGQEFFLESIDVE